MNHSFWNGRSVLVTGATGLLGGWLVKRLLGAGAIVVVLVRNRTSSSIVVREGLLDQSIIIDGELTDAALIHDALERHTPQTVFHLAAQTQVGTAWQDPVSTFESNIKGSWVLLDACRKAETPQIILSSSDKAYGSTGGLPHLETHPLQARFPYDVSKSCADLIAQMYATSYGLPVCVARCGNIFGGGDMNFNRAIPGLIRDTFYGKRFVIRSDGRSIRDFLYVEDAVEAYVRLAECLDTSPSLIGEAFNFSMGARVTVLELVQHVINIMGRSDLVPLIRNTTSHEVREQYLSAQKSKETLGWSPQFDMEEALSQTVAWYEKYFSSIGSTVIDQARNTVTH